MTETRYSYTLDPYPQQYEDGSRLYEFYDNLREGRLTTTKCKNCGHIPWPPRVVCPQCLSDDLELIDMPQTGKIYSYTIQVAAVPPGYEPPLIYALVDFDNLFIVGSNRPASAIDFHNNILVNSIKNN